MTKEGDKETTALKDITARKEPRWPEPRVFILKAIFDFFGTVMRTNSNVGIILELS